MTDSELLAAVIEANNCVASAMKLLADHVKTLTAEVADQRAKIESIAFIQRAGKHAN